MGKKIFKFLASVFLAFFLLESGLQLLSYVRHRNDPGYQHLFSKFAKAKATPSNVEFDPYLFYRRKPLLGPESLGTWYTDRHGFLCFEKSEQERDLFQKGLKKRIFIFGASTPEGIDSVYNLGALLKKYLARDDYDVILATGPAQGSMQELLTLQTKVLYMHPDVLLTFNGSVDAMQSVLVRDYQRNDHSYAVELKLKIDGSEVEQSAVPSPSMDLLVHALSATRQLKIFQIIDGLIARWMPLAPSANAREVLYFTKIFDLKHPVFRQEGLDAYIRNLESFSSIARDNDIKAVHILQPTLAREILRKKEAATADDKLLMVRFAENHMKIEPATLIRPVDRFFVESSLKFNAKNKQFWWNYLDEFPAGQTSLSKLYIDHIHYQKDMLELLAARIAKDLVKKQIL